DEDADDRGVEEEHQPEVRAHALAARPERIRDAGGHHDDGEPDEPDRERIHADVVGDAEGAEPTVLLRELQAAPREVETGEQLDPDADLCKRGEHGDRARGDAVHRQEPDDESGRGREDDQGRGHRTATKTMARTASEDAIASAYVRRSPVCRREKTPPTSRVSSPISSLVSRMSGRSIHAPSAFAR